MEFVLSGYGRKPQTSMTLYRMKEDKTLKHLWETSVNEPSFVCQGDGLLFAVSEVLDSASIYVFRREGCQYILSDEKVIDGGLLCHISYSSKNKSLYGACYETGTVFSVRVNQDKFGEVLYQEIQKGTDPNELTRAHCVFLNREETKLFVANIALDRLFIYDIAEGYLTLNSLITLPVGVGPRHVLLSMDGKYLYVITEYSNEILLYRIDASLEQLQRISTLSEGYNGQSFCSTMCLSRDGAYLYAANRGADTIALFRRAENGFLHKIKEYSCGGKHPRHMMISNDGKYLIVCNQNSDRVVIFELDEVTGSLKSEAAVLSFAAPSGVVEIPAI
ncbi:MAG: 3-carboxymuconate cyclase-like protein [Herbinix sp.]|jgi:6-phosphogluconolactonase|nr:3-carboxymuconate cyclase-like protein [Herbinix sp.]